MGYAAKGIRQLVIREHNARIHLLSTLAVIIAGIQLHLSMLEWVGIVIAIGLVWMAEILNTCIEQIMDYIRTEEDSKIALIKDMAAAAVLISSLTAIVIGLIILLPKIL